MQGGLDQGPLIPGGPGRWRQPHTARMQSPVTARGSWNQGRRGTARARRQEASEHTSGSLLCCVAHRMREAGRCWGCPAAARACCRGAGCAGPGGRVQAPGCGGLTTCTKHSGVARLGRMLVSRRRAPARAGGRRRLRPRAHLAVAASISTMAAAAPAAPPRERIPKFIVLESHRRVPGLGAGRVCRRTSW